MSSADASRNQKVVSGRSGAEKISGHDSSSCLLCLDILNRVSRRNMCPNRRPPAEDVSQRDLLRRTAEFPPVLPPIAAAVVPLRPHAQCSPMSIRADRLSLNVTLLLRGCTTVATGCPTVNDTDRLDEGGKMSITTNKLQTE